MTRRTLNEYTDTRRQSNRPPTTQVGPDPTESRWSTIESRRGPDEPKKKNTDVPRFSLWFLHNGKGSGDVDSSADRRITRSVQYTNSVYSVILVCVLLCPSCNGPIVKLVRRSERFCITKGRWSPTIERSSVYAKRKERITNEFSYGTCILNDF